MTKPTLAFIGAGTLGTALAHGVASAGYSVTMIFSRELEDAKRLAGSLPEAMAISSVDEIATADLIFLTVPDDEITRVCNAVRWRPKSYVVHCSGALSLEALEFAAKLGAKTGSLHPLQTFARGDHQVARLADIAYAIEASDGSIRRVLEELVRNLGGRSQWIRGADKPLYHASAAMASNYLLSLLGDASKLWESFGLSREQGMHSLLPLVKGTLDNLQDIGFPDALTGPIARGDVETVEIHLEALTSSQPDILPSYVAMGKRTIAMALEKGTLTVRSAEAIAQLLDAAEGRETAS